MAECRIVLVCRWDDMTNPIRAITKDAELVGIRRAQIVEAAVGLFVKKGYAQTTVSEIARQCGVSKGSLYNYVGSKEDIIYLILDHTQQVHGRHFAEVESSLSTLTSADALRRAMTVYIQGVDEMQDAYNFLNHVEAELDQQGRKRMHQASTRVGDFFEMLLVRGVESGEFEVDNPRLAGHLIARMCSAWAHNRWFLRGLLSLDEFTTQLTELMLKAVRADG